MKAFWFVFRIALAWGVFLSAFLAFLEAAFGPKKAEVAAALAMIAIFVVIVRAISHVHRVRLIAEDPATVSYSSRHRRRIEIPLPPSEAFELVDAAVRELPYVETVESTKDSLQIFARVKRTDPYLSSKHGRRLAVGSSGARRNLITATIKPGEDSGSLTIICGPEGGAWVDWFKVDDGTNLENMEAIQRAITRRISEKRKSEAAAVIESATDKELAVAKLNLLHAQVEPHFLYNTLASAQLLTRSDPAKADRMLGNLITYLRRSVPRAEEAMSTLGEEVERAQAYLEILRIRMGDRLNVQIQMPEELKHAPVPAMMVQTLVENAVKHGLEPVPGGGTVWIIARPADGKVAITVADDGRGFSEDGGGTGIGLKNVRERLKLAYGDAASFSIGANFPRGVAATIAVPNA
jgi:signal transduction histidine kinase